MGNELSQEEKQARINDQIAKRPGPGAPTLASQGPTPSSQRYSTRLLQQPIAYSSFDEYFLGDIHSELASN